MKLVFFKIQSAERMDEIKDGGIEGGGILISSLVLCEALSDGHVPVSNGYLLFSALTRRLSEFGGPEPLHGAPGFKGVALSALTPESFWRTLHYSWGKGVLQLQKGDRLAFRVSFLDDALLEPFAEAVTGSSLTLGGAPVGVKRVSRPGENAMSRQTDEGALRGLSPCGGADVTFLSPTGFKSGAVQNILPSPELWFRSLAARWKTAYGENPLENLNQENLDQEHPKLENPIKNALANTFVADYSLRSAAVVLKENLVFRGCVGRVRYVWKNESTAVRKALACLTAFAFFCGVGYKTTQGMGQVLAEF